jgi:hypothetical protein
LLEPELLDTLEDIMLEDTSDTLERDISENGGITDTLGPPEVPSYKSEMIETIETLIFLPVEPSDTKRYKLGTDTTDGTKDGELSMLKDKTLC